jgi:hypothetical protein
MIQNCSSLFADLASMTGSICVGMKLSWPPNLITEADQDVGNVDGRTEHLVGEKSELIRRKGKWNQ